MEDRRRRSSSKAARRLRRVLTLAREYMEYMFMNRRRLLGRVARRTLVVLSSYHGNTSKHLAPYYLPPRALMEHEFSFRDSPSPAFLAAKRLQLRLQRGAAAGTAVSSCFGNLRASYVGSPSPPRPATEKTENKVVEEEEDEEKEEADEWMLGEVELEVDYRAEEFINMFYEQLRAQSFAAVSSAHRDVPRRACATGEIQGSFAV